MAVLSKEAERKRVSGNKERLLEGRQPIESKMAAADDRRRTTVENITVPRYRGPDWMTRS